MDVQGWSAAFPRLAIFILERRRLLQRCLPVPGTVKLLVAPAGYGKTVLVSQIDQQFPGRYGYIGLSEVDDERSVRQKLGWIKGQGLHPIIDDAHLAAPSGRAALREALCTLKPDSEVIVCSRTSHDIAEKRSLFDGTIDVIGAVELAFTLDEVRALSERCNVSYRETMLAQFIQLTGGWPMAVCGSLRAAGDRALAVRDAFSAWYELHGPNLAQFVTEECARVPLGETFLERVRSGMPSTVQELQAWQSAGLFVAGSGRDCHILPVVCGIFGNEPGNATESLQPLRIGLLTDDMRTTVGDIKLQWVRHKDAQIFKYLVLKNAHATRAELMEIFWPGRDRNIQAQNLRTTCSNIRRALRWVVGTQLVERYFESNGHVRVAAPVVTDIEEFNETVSLGRIALAAGDSRNARLHFKHARDLYKADLLTGMPRCGFEDLAISLRHDFGEVVHRLRTLPEVAEPRANAS